MSVSRQFCTFFVDENLLGIDVLDVQEIVRSRAMTPVPLAHPAVRGLINLRGQIVTAIDLRRRLGLSDRGGTFGGASVVVRTVDGAVSILVDEVGDVLEAEEERFERPPETLPRRVRELVEGVYKLPDRLLIVLDAKAVVDLREPRD